ncbi:Transcriptional regulator, IclR family [metagenome]|uniref:Transcriptional regulator, IclR family n=1 Tax=metagenome TaxID=256318 RepID=A0A2P2C8Z0_9ZZZZ
MTTDLPAAVDRSRRSIQSIGRAFAVLEAMAAAGGIDSISSLSERLSLPLPTIHRLLRTLVELGYARQEPSRMYALGPRLVNLGEASNRLTQAWAGPPLRALADEVGETASFAVLDGVAVVFGAQASGRHSMQMVNEVGRRLGIHCTAAGKAILAGMPPEQAARLVATADMRAYTDRTITSVDALMHEVEASRERGYALEMGEQEVGVSAVAVALPGDIRRGAVIISGPSARMGDDTVRRFVPLLLNTAKELAVELALAAP